ncbi:MAG: OmpA family protein [Pseudomonadota bacterium]
MQDLKQFRLWPLAGIFLAISAGLGFAQAPPGDQPLVDVPGAGEPEGIPRLTDSIIIGFDQSDFDEHRVLLAPLDGYNVTDSKRVEGPRTRLIYLVPDDKSPLEVTRNYQAALTSMGFGETFYCSAEDCGEASAMLDVVYPSDGRLKNYGQITEYALQFPRNDHKYLAMENPSTGQVVTVWVAYDTFNIDQRSANSTMALVDIVGGEAFEADMEIVTREQVAEGLGADGKVTLAGIFFATDSDEITADSRPALDEIAAFLQGAPEIKAYVVGHTDATGDFAYNMDLSQRRAASVAQALEGYGIGSDRLVPAGVGPLAPEGSNSTEDGRRANRRVELVAR